jgi:hypothetical protein
VNLLEEGFGNNNNNNRSCILRVAGKSRSKWFLSLSKFKFKVSVQENQMREMLRSSGVVTNLFCSKAVMPPEFVYEIL